MRRDEKADAIRERLHDLCEKYGRLTPMLVVEDAEDPGSPLHDQFEWDDTVAAKAWREEQARTLIRSVHLVITTETKILQTVAYVRDPNAKAGEQGYVSVEALRDNPKSARSALRYECSRAAGLLERSRHLAVALGLTDEVDEILDRMGALSVRIADEEVTAA